MDSLWQQNFDGSDPREKQQSGTKVRQMISEIAETIENKVWKSGQEESWPKEVVIYTDGASRGNPGPSSLGLVVYDSKGDFLFEYALTLGTQTNNHAEYCAVLKALQLAQSQSVQKLILRSDSQLLVRQLTGIYKVKSSTLKPLFQKSFELAKMIACVEFEHVYREDNKYADALANKVLDT